MRNIGLNLVEKTVGYQEGDFIIPSLVGPDKLIVYRIRSFLAYPQNQSQQAFPILVPQAAARLLAL